METTATETRTDKRMFNGREVELNFKGEKLISVTADGKEARICKSEYKTLYKAYDVEFEVPKQTEYAKIITGVKQFTVEDGNLVEKEIPSHLAAGIYRNTRLVKRCFFQKDGNSLLLPFEKKCIGTIEIETCITHTGEEKVIVNYAVSEIYDHKIHGKLKLKKIKFTSEMPEKHEFVFDLFPGEEKNEYIVVK